MAKTLQANVDAVITVPGVVDGLPMQQITGGDITADTTPDRPPGARFQEKTPGVPDISDVVCTPPWDEAVHGPLKSLLDNACSYSEDCTVGKVIRDKNHNRLRMDTFAPCALIGVSGPEGNTTSNDAGTLVLTFAVNGIA
jgi:hypothetical protein